jgi:hypothetical protein
MNRAENFQSALFFVLVVVAVLTCLAFQNAGDTGTATISQPVTYTGTGTGPYISSVCPPLKSCQPIFTNVGQSAHYLQYCAGSSGFTGTVDLEESFDGATNWTPIAYASYIAAPLAANTCNHLQAGGYYQNIRSVANNVTAGSLTAFYNASSGPIAYTPVGIGAMGSTSPTVCNQSADVSVAPATTALVVAEVPNSTIRICAYQSFSNTGNVYFQSSTGASTCTGLTTVWTLVGTAGGQNIALGGGVGQLVSTLPNNSLCVDNTTGGTLVLNITYASVANGF